MPVHVSKGIKTSKFSYITKHIDLHLTNMETIHAIDSTMLPRFFSKNTVTVGPQKGSSREYHH